MGSINAKDSASAEAFSSDPRRADDTVEDGEADDERAPAMPPSDADMEGSAEEPPPSPPTSADKPELIPTVFKWDHGGHNVYLSGTFNEWSRKIPMHRSGNDFTYVLNLARGKHAFKFIVDDEWRFAPDQQVVMDASGNVNNFIDLDTFDPSEDTRISKSTTVAEHLSYRRQVPDSSGYTGEPPLLPPHLRYIVLNTPAHPSDPSLLPTPQHVSLNHLFCTAIRDGLMVQGISQRYRQKHVTTVFYSLMPVPSSAAAAGGDKAAAAAST